MTCPNMYETGTFVNKHLCEKTELDTECYCKRRSKRSGGVGCTQCSSFSGAVIL